MYVMDAMTPIVLPYLNDTNSNLYLALLNLNLDYPNYFVLDLMMCCYYGTLARWIQQCPSDDEKRKLQLKITVNCEVTQTIAGEIKQKPQITDLILTIL